MLPDVDHDGARKDAVLLAAIAGQRTETDDEGRLTRRHVRTLAGAVDEPDLAVRGSLGEYRQVSFFGDHRPERGYLGKIGSLLGIGAGDNTVEDCLQGCRARETENGAA